MEKPFKKLNKIKSEELDKFFDGRDEKSKIRQRKEWKENRAEFLKNKCVCEWCGEKPDVFQVHHTWGRHYGRLWLNAADKAFAQSEAFDPSLAEKRKECPECGLRDYYERKTKSPRYRCQRCKEEFERPRLVDESDVISSKRYDTKPYVSYQYYKEKAKWVNSNREAVNEVFKKLYKKTLKEYVSMKEDQVVAICRTCHFKYEQTEQKLCSRCESNFHKPDKQMCWNCIVEKEGLEKCGECGDGWFQPNKYDKCSSCR